MLSIDKILGMASGPPKFNKKVYKLKGYGNYIKSYTDWERLLTIYNPEPGLDNWLYYDIWPAKIRSLNVTWKLEYMVG